jgi:hypothetical protein
VWTSDHIADLFVLKARQPRDGATAETRGLGWSPDDAVNLLHDFLYDLAYDMTNGGRIEIVNVDGHPPLTQEESGRRIGGGRGAKSRTTELVARLPHDGTDRRPRSTGDRHRTTRIPVVDRASAP